MLQLVEMEGKMTENGCIEIPAVVLEQAGICTGEIGRASCRERV